MSSEIISIQVYENYYLITKEFKVLGDEEIVLNGDNLNVDLNSIQITDPNQTGQPIISKLQVPQSYEDYIKYSNVKVTYINGKSINCRVLQVTPITPQYGFGSQSTSAFGSSTTAVDHHHTMKPTTNSYIKVLDTSTHEIIDIDSNEVTSITPLDNEFISHIDNKSPQSIQIQLFGDSIRHVKIQYKCTVLPSKSNLSISNLSNQFQNVNLNTLFPTTTPKKQIHNFNIKLDILNSNIHSIYNHDYNCSGNENENISNLQELYTSKNSGDFKFTIIQSIEWSPPFSFSAIPVEFKVVDTKSKKLYTFKFESLTCSHSQEYTFPLVTLNDVVFEKAKMIKPISKSFTPYFLFKNTSSTNTILTNGNKSFSHTELQNAVEPNRWGLIGFYTSVGLFNTSSQFTHPGATNSTIDEEVSDLTLLTPSDSTSVNRIDTLKVLKTPEFYYDFHKLISSSLIFTNLSENYQHALIKIQYSNSIVPEVSNEFEFVCDDNEYISGRNNSFKIYKVSMDPFSRQILPIKIKIPTKNIHAISASHSYREDFKLEELNSCPGVSYSVKNDLDIYTLDYSNGEQITVQSWIFEKLQNLTQSFSTQFSTNSVALSNLFGAPKQKFGTTFGGTVQQPQIAFGQSSPFSTNTGFGTSATPNFGSTPTTPSTGTGSGFSFGRGFGQSSGFGQSTGFGTTPTISGGVFGTTSTTIPSSSGMFSFGLPSNTTTTTPTTNSSGFGSSSTVTPSTTTPASGFTFGVPSTTTTKLATTNTTSGFGSSSTVTPFTTTPASGFSFSLPSTTTPSTTTNAFTFGSPSTSVPPATGGFGLPPTTTPPINTNAFTFGSPSTTSTTGFTGFGSPSTNIPTTNVFTFGAPQTTNPVSTNTNSCFGSAPVTLFPGSPSTTTPSITTAGGFESPSTTPPNTTPSNVNITGDPSGPGLINFQKEKYGAHLSKHESEGTPLFTLVPHDNKNNLKVVDGVHINCDKLYVENPVSFEEQRYKDFNK